jgi:glucosamine kinase
MIPASGMHSPSIVVGIDIGWTKTHLRAVGNGRTFDLVRPTSEWRRRDWGEDAATLLGMVGELANGAAVAAIGIGAHGCDDAGECAGFQAEFTKRTGVPVAVVNDAELMPLALDLSHQIGLVAGTGSIAVCRTAAGEMLVAGGWGWAIGDEGSAAGLVREAARAVALHMDKGGSLDEPLCRAIFEALRIPSPARVGSSLAKLGNGATIGSHAHAVFEAAGRGSELARRVIGEGGEALAALVRRLDERGAGAGHVVAGGGVIVAQPLLWEAFREGLARHCGDSIAPHLFRGEPVEGACRLASAMAGGPAASRKVATAKQ